jgi:hypothetical protein
LLAIARQDRILMVKLKHPCEWVNVLVRSTASR